MKCLADFYPNRVELIEIGKSFEGRPLAVLKIKGTTSTRRAIWIDANIHAREWITSATALFFVNQLVENPNSPYNQEITSDFDFYIMPMANPDG